MTTVYICEICGKSFLTNKTIRKDRYIRCDECKQHRKHSKEQEINSILDCSKRTISKILNRSKIGCAICGWNESTCDIHHIIEKCNGGTDDVSNLIIVCPNHHRIIHTNKCYSVEYLQNLSIKNTFNNWKKTIEKQNPDWSLVIDNIQYSVEKQLIYIFILYHLEKYE